MKPKWRRLIAFIVSVVFGNILMNFMLGMNIRDALLDTG
jgi:hypothetical protein